MPKDPYPLVAGFEWVTMDMEDEKEVCATYTVKLWNALRLVEVYGLQSFFAHLEMVLCWQSVVGVVCTMATMERANTSNV